jgi:hypothetical protein
MKKYGNCFQWRSKLLKPKMLFFSVGNGAMNAPRYWQQRNERVGFLMALTGWGTGGFV